MPGPVPGRAPNITVTLFSDGINRIVTQIFFAGHPANDTDPMAVLMGDAFERNIGKPYETLDIDVHQGFRFDIVAGGRNATFFE
ncbi:MAG: hypothetical protein ACU0AX_09855 [Roseovarius sp.]|uniref:hypothetical protein n=1 Tax=Roseovarius sp. TaxID=1486281 RepID=UPI00405820A1